MVLFFFIIWGERCSLKSRRKQYFSLYVFMATVTSALCVVPCGVVVSVDPILRAERCGDYSHQSYKNMQASRETFKASTTCAGVQQGSALILFMFLQTLVAPVSAFKCTNQTRAWQDQKYYKQY